MTGKPKPIEQRFWPRVEKTDTCWNWTASTNQQGYGRLTFRGTKWGAHRISYTLAKGEIPDGYVVHHECNNRRCVRPDHLVAVEQLRNVQEMDRQGRGSRGKHDRVLVTRCRYGHDYTPENTVIEFSNKRMKPYRVCRTCKNKRGREHMRRLRAAT